MKLAFPDFSFQIKTEKNKNYIFDIIRKKYVVVNPEEWVRQHLIHHLIALEYPQGLISVERSFDGSSKRYDGIVYNREMQPLLLIECKSPTIAIDQKTLNQAAGYLGLVDVNYVLLTNGINHYCIERTNNEIKVSKEIPSFSEISK